MCVRNSNGVLFLPYFTANNMYEHATYIYTSSRTVSKVSCGNLRFTIYLYTFNLYWVEPYGITATIVRKHYITVVPGARAHQRLNFKIIFRALQAKPALLQYIVRISPTGPLVCEFYLALLLSYVCIKLNLLVRGKWRKEMAWHSHMYKTLKVNILLKIMALSETFGIHL